MAEKEKYRKDARSTGPIQSNSTKRFVPLAMSHMGMRASHFNASLKEFAIIVVTKPSGCSLMKGPFALSMKGAIRRILNAWGARVTWTAQRQHATHALHNMESFYSCASFLSFVEHGFAASGLLPECRTAGLLLDSHARGPALLPSLDHVHMPVGAAWTNCSSGGRDDGFLSSAFDLGQGSSLRGGKGALSKVLLTLLY
jgi:hypothetical protein